MQQRDQIARRKCENVAISCKREGTIREWERDTKDTITRLYNEATSRLEEQFRALYRS
jgi:hypothetical protein